MDINLQKASYDDCEVIHEMQLRSFRQLLDKYQDFATNPGAESLVLIIGRMQQDFNDYYLIQLDGQNIGAIRVQRRPDNRCRISPLFLLPEFHGQGFAQQVIRAVEELYPHAVAWQLETIKEEPKLLYLYEKMGYKRTGKEVVIQDNMTIVHYSKSKPVR